MTNEERVKELVESFFSAIAPIEDAFVDDSFAYIAFKREGSFVIAQARLLLNTGKMAALPLPFESENIKAGHFMLRDAKLARRNVVSALLAGSLETPDGALRFMPNDSNQYSAHYQPFHNDGLKNQTRIAHLTLMGGPLPEYRTRRLELDWELRGAKTPYDGIQDLLNEFGPGFIGDNSNVEVAAFNAATVDADSVVEGERAKLAIRTALSADISKVSVGYRILSAGKVIERRTIKGSQFTWRDQDGYKLGRIELAVPRASVVHATAIYAGVPQQHWFFRDPESFQNPRQAAYEAFDPKCALFDDILARAQQPMKPEARDFEIAMSWLFWMLGFAPASLAGVPRLSNSADAILSTPKGNIVVLECTVGLLKDDSKVPRVHDRASAIRRNLDHSSTRHIRVLPVIVTVKSADEISPEKDGAVQSGIYVITREGIERLKQRSLFVTDADQLFEQAEQELSAALEHLNTVDGGFYEEFVEDDEYPG
jgi:hypothetical protein